MVEVVHYLCILNGLPCEIRTNEETRSIGFNPWYFRYQRNGYIRFTSGIKPNYRDSILINTTCKYNLATIATMWGIIPYTTGAFSPWTTPFFFSGWLSTGSIVAGFFQIFLILLGCLIYFPFFKALDNQYLKEEAGSSMLTGDELDDVDLNDLSFDDL